MDDHPGRFVDHEKVGIVVEQVEGDVFRNDPGIDGRRERDIHLVALPDPVVRRDRPPVQPDVGALDQALDPGAGMSLQAVDEELIQSRSIMPLVD